MSLSVGDLKDALLKATKDLEDTSGIGAVGDAIKEYVEKNAEGSTPWVGVNPASGAPDSTTSFDWEITIPAMVLTPSQVNDPAAAMSILGAQIMAGLIGGIWQCKDTTFVPPVFPMAMSPSVPSLSGLSIDSEEREDAMEQLADQIVSAITSAPLPVAGIPGVHAAYLGALAGPMIIS